jgi:hypothetical protein
VDAAVATTPITRASCTAASCRDFIFVVCVLKFDSPLPDDHRANTLRQPTVSATPAPVSTEVEWGRGRTDLTLGLLPPLPDVTNSAAFIFIITSALLRRFHRK